MMTVSGTVFEIIEGDLNLSEDHPSGHRVSHRYTEELLDVQPQFQQLRSRTLIQVLSELTHPRHVTNCILETVCIVTTSCIHSFIPDISIAPLQVHYYSEALPTRALILCRSQDAKALEATTSEGLAQGPYTWRLEWGSNLLGGVTVLNVHNLSSLYIRLNNI